MYIFFPCDIIVPHIDSRVRIIDNLYQKGGLGSLPPGAAYEYSTCR
jgi:hypothetical protein